MSDAPPVINGWAVYAHPLFLGQLEALVATVEAARAKDPEGYTRKRAAKLLAALLKIAFTIIPEDPARTLYRQGDTLGPEHRHWFRAKFLQQYRLFFRYQDSGAAKVIVLAWVNDADTLRAYDSASDAYAVFRRMLERGSPPGDWEALVAAAKAPVPRARLRRARVGVTPKGRSAVGADVGGRAQGGAGQRDADGDGRDDDHGHGDGSG